jgi:hypothetical protein
MNTFKTILANIGIKNPVMNDAAILEDRKLQVIARGVMPCYKLFLKKDGVEIEKDVRPSNYHEKYQAIFEQILFTRFPREDYKIYNFRLSQANMQAYSGEYTRAISTAIGLLSQGTNYELTTDNEPLLNWNKDTKFRSFLFDDLFRWGISSSPNGVVAVLDSHTEEFGADTPYQPIVKLFDADSYYIYNGDWYLYDEQNSLLHIIKTDAYETYRVQDNNITDGISTPNPTGMITAFIYGGIKNDDTPLYRSHYGNAVGWAIDAIRAHSDSEVTDKNTAYPIVVVDEQEDCNECGGGGYTYPNGCTSDTCKETCQACKGRGKKVISRSPSDVIVRPKKRFADGDTSDKEPISFISPDVDSNRYLNDKFADRYSRFLKSLTLFDIGYNQSGISKQKDQEQRTVETIALGEHFYNVVSAIYGYVAKLINNGGDVHFTVKKPTDIELTTEDSVLARYVEAVEKNLPQDVTSYNREQYYQKLSERGGIMAKRAKVLDIINPLSGYEPSELSAVSLITSDKYPFLAYIYAGVELERYVLEVGEQRFLELDTLVIADNLKSIITKKYMGVNDTSGVQTAVR